MPRYKVDVPEGVSGDWEVKRFIVSKSDAESSTTRDASRAVPAGEYTMIQRDGCTIMSDTHAEVRDHLDAIHQAHRLGGVCLVNGLGLGMVANAMLQSEGVIRVEVVEASSDVISLIAPHYEARYGDRIKIHHADAFEFAPPDGVRYTVVWHDIWDDICCDNLEEMKWLHLKYGRRADWQRSWCRDECEWQERELKRSRLSNETANYRIGVVR